jgi:hypothetical protein
MIDKYVCIDKCNFNTNNTFLSEDDIKYFIIGNIYEWTYDKEDNVYLHKHWVVFPEDIDRYFINLNKWREKIINKILEDD